MIKWGKRVLIALFGIAIGIIGYNAYLNHEIRVVEQVVFIENLPSSFEEFKILQVTDLHGFWFGNEQAQLIDLVEGIDYDLLALTGDLGDLNDDPNGIAMQAFIEGISKSKPIVYVEGNHGPFVRDKATGEKTDVAYWLENQGVELLFEPILIEEAGQRLWIAQQTEPFWQASGLEDVKEEDVLIGIMHYPMDEHFYQAKRESGQFPPYDLILAGHFHGGQWRIPFYGAIFVSDVYGNGWFPSQDRVSGLTEWSGYYQYVSRGLGASGSNPLLKQRWFNPPEINVLTLRGQK